MCLQPFLITENMWPRGCVLDCQRGRHRAVCGSNGQLYKSVCAFQRAQCINTQLRLAPRAHCSGTHTCPSPQPDRLQLRVSTVTGIIFNQLSQQTTDLFPISTCPVLISLQIRVSPSASRPGLRLWTPAATTAVAT